MTPLQTSPRWRQPVVRQAKRGFNSVRSAREFKVSKSFPEMSNIVFGDRSYDLRSIRV
jgi:hypothetical protein